MCLQISAKASELVLNCVAKIDLDKSKVEYSKDITKPKIEKLGPEEVVRAFLIDKLVNELGYSEKNIELETAPRKKKLEQLNISRFVFCRVAVFQDFVFGGYHVFKILFRARETY